MLESGNEGLKYRNKLQLRDLLERFVDIISLNDGDLGKAQHKIDTGNASSIKQSARRLPYHSRGRFDRCSTTTSLAYTNSGPCLLGSQMHTIKRSRITSERRRYVTHLHVRVLECLWYPWLQLTTPVGLHMYVRVSRKGKFVVSLAALGLY